MQLDWKWRYWIRSSARSCCQCFKLEVRNARLTYVAELRPLPDPQAMLVKCELTLTGCTAVRQGERLSEGHCFQSTGCLSSLPSMPDMSGEVVRPLQRHSSVWRAVCTRAVQRLVLARCGRPELDE